MNEIFRERRPNIRARLKHETFTRSDALLACDGTVPPGLSDHDLPLGSYPLTSQFSRAFFTAEADAFVLSIQPDVVAHMMRHRRDGYLFYANEAAPWPPEQRAWLKSEFTPVDLLDVEESMSNLTKIVGLIQQRTEAPILIYNLSPIIPGDHVYCYIGLDETFANRIRRFNLALTELSAQTGISIIDVDAIVARAGAGALKLDAVHLTAPGYPLVAAEVVRVLDDLGVLQEGVQ